MEALLYTFSSATAFDATASVVAPARVRDRIVMQGHCSGFGGHKAGRNAGEINALLARCVR